MAKIIGLPKLSPTMEEGTLASWSKQEGDSVEIDDLLAEVETDKATMEFRSFDKGVLLKILADEGDTLAPDAPVAIIGEEGEDISDLIEKAKGGASAPAPKPESKSEQKSDDEANDAADRDADDQAEADPQSQANKGAPSSGAQARTADGRVLASPVVRKIAREKDIDLSQIEGSGPRGRIIKRDLEAAPIGKAKAKGAGVTQGKSAEPTLEPLSQMRKAIARRLTESKQTVPHFYLTIDVDAEPIMEARKAINAELEKDGAARSRLAKSQEGRRSAEGISDTTGNSSRTDRVSVNDMIIKAVAMALKRYPRANASYTDKNIVVHNRVDISVAVAVPEGLMTPVIRGADQKGIREIGQEVRQLAEKARNKKLQPDEYSDGTFSISNLGMYGIEDFSAVINPPEGAILAVGALREEPVVKNGELAVGKRMRMTLSCDHRVIDGAIGAEFLSVLRRMLESPTSMLI